MPRSRVNSAMSMPAPLQTSSLPGKTATHATPRMISIRVAMGPIAVHATLPGWLPAAFDHNLSTFKLTGKHSTVACTGCHIDNIFQGTPTDCFTCHQKDDKHKGQFGTNCATCHSTSGWSPATFDHNLSTFKLTGKHITIACESCHINNDFKGTPTDCYSCHAANDTHSGRFGTNCEFLPHYQRLDAGHLRPQLIPIQTDRGTRQRGLCELSHQSRLPGHTHQLRCLSRRTSWSFRCRLRILPYNQRLDTGNLRSQSIRISFDRCALQPGLHAMSHRWKLQRALNSLRGLSRRTSRSLWF